MDRRWGRAMAAVGLAAVLVAGCSSSGAQPDADPTTPSPTTAPTEVSAAPSPSPATSTPDDPFAIPDPVTPEYVDRVVNTIYEEWGAIFRELLEQPADPTAVTPVETRERMADLFAGEYLQRRFEEADGVLRGERDNLLTPQEFRHFGFESRSITRASHRCIVAVGDLSFEHTSTSGGSALVAVSLTPSRDANTTGWLIRDVLTNTDPEGNVLPDEMMLDASVEDFGESLEHTCAGEET